MLLCYLLLLHLPNLVLQLPLILNVVILDGCLVAPVQDLPHGRLHVPWLVLHAEHDCCLGLQRLKEPDVPLLQGFVLQGYKLVLRQVLLLMFHSR